MTINTTAMRTVQTGNGATTVWNYSFIIPDASEAVVQITDKTTGAVTTLTTTQYSITGIGSASGGTVTYSPALTTNQTITISRVMPVTQTTSLSNQGAFYPAVVESALDYLTMVAQQLTDSISRAILSSGTGAGTVDVGTNRIINLVAGINSTDAVTLAQLQAQFAASGNVPSPTAPQAGMTLKATGAAAFGWNTNQVTSANITDSTSAGRNLLTAADLPTQQSILGVTGGYKNKIINGQFFVNQYKGTGAYTPSTALEYVVDRWFLSVSQNSKITTQTFNNIATAPIVAGSPGYNAWYQQHTVAVAVAAPGAGDFFIQGQRIEGLNCYDLAWGTANAKSISISMVIQSSLTGNFGIAVSNGAANRSYVHMVSLTAGTAVRVSFTVPGDTSGTWSTSAGATGLQLSICFGAGATYQTTADAWQAGAFYTTSTQTQWISTAAATFKVTDIQVENSSSATNFERRPQQIELSMCQWYFVSIFQGVSLIGYQTAGNTASHTFILPPMGKVATYYLVGSWTLTNCSTPVAVVSYQSFSLATVLVGTGTYQFTLAASASLNFNAEL